MHGLGIPVGSVFPVTSFYNVQSTYCHLSNYLSFFPPNQSVMIDATIMENVKETEVVIVFQAGTENFALFPVVQIIVSIEVFAN